MKKILTVSTDRLLLDVLNRNLAGYAIEQVTDAGTLFNTIDLLNPDILLVDFILDNLNGGAICHQVKCSPETSHLPVILITEFEGLGRTSQKFGSNAIVKRSALFPALHHALLNMPERLVPTIR
jgi:DNA-binding response OmpR family regulator